VVVVLFPLLLWMTGFLEPQEWRRLAAVWHSLQARRKLRAAPDESAEMGGELVADLSGRVEPNGDDDAPGARREG
jgi:hypothetical protein